MGNLQVSKEEMLKRVARFKQVAPSEYAFVDSKIPGHERLIYNVIGGGVTEDPSHTPAIEDARDFNVTFVKAEPGKGAALHSGTTVEVFTPLSGRWAIIWADCWRERVDSQDVGHDFCAARGDAQLSQRGRRRCL
jgi:hypothetical protein